MGPMRPVSHGVTPCHTSHGCHGMSQAEMAKAGGLGSKVALTSAVHGQKSRIIKNDQDKLRYTNATPMLQKSTESCAGGDPQRQWSSVSATALKHSSTFCIFALFGFFVIVRCTRPKSASVHLSWMLKAYLLQPGWMQTLRTEHFQQFSTLRPGMTSALQVKQPVGALSETLAGTSTAETRGWDSTMVLNLPETSTAET